MVLSSGWAGEKRFSTWFSGDQPVAQWQKAQARKQFEVFSKLYDDGKRHRVHMHQRTQPVLPIWGRDDYERNVSLEQWNPWSPGKRAYNRLGGTHAVSQALVSLMSRPQPRLVPAITLAQNHHRAAPSKL